MADKTSKKSDSSSKGAKSPNSVPTDFIWQVYVDATLAGVAKLIPIPFADLVVEEYFRRRMPRDIAAYNGRILPQSVLRKINRRRSSNPLLGILMLPFRAITYLFKDIFRTVLYALSIADAAENLGYYWHRAFLIHYATTRGHFDTAHKAELAIAAIDRTLAEATTSPLQQLAQQVIINWKSQIVRLRTYVGYARNKTESKRLESARETMQTAWGNYDAYWRQVAAAYDDAYESAAVFQQVQAGSEKPQIGEAA